MLTVANDDCALSGVGRDVFLERPEHLVQPAAKARANKKKAEELKRQKEAQKESETVLTQWKAGLVDPQIPLRPLPHATEVAALDQLRNCTPLSPSDPVSCCMLTIPQVHLPKP